jgi:hydrogenase maturation protease
MAGCSTRCAAVTDSVLYVGFGNPLRGDDGVGPLVARRLAELGFAAIEAVQLTPEMAEPVSNADRVVFIDADASLPAGEVRRLAVGASANDSFEHHVTPAQVLDIAEALYGLRPEAVIVAVGAESFAFGEGLSETVRDAAESFLREDEGERCRLA